MVRDLAREQRKEINLIVEGSETELDKAILDAIGEPLMHLVRNSIDHGIETPEEREKKGKTRVGTIRLAVKRAESNTIIEVEDDGRGIDLRRVREVALEKGFLVPDNLASVQDKDVMNVLFKSGFSTAEKVTSVSGRGVGLDIVRTSVKRLGGLVEVATELNKGTKFSMRLPLSSAIFQTLIVSSSGQTFMIPSDIVVETLEVEPEEIKRIGKAGTIILHGRLMAFLSLAEALNLPSDRSHETAAVIIHLGEQALAVGVDAVIDQAESIIKPFDQLAQKTKGFSGGSILGDGTIALLLDVQSLFEHEAVRKERYLHEQ